MNWNNKLVLGIILQVKKVVNENHYGHREQKQTYFALLSIVTQIFTDNVTNKSSTDNQTSISFQLIIKKGESRYISLYQFLHRSQ